MKIRLLALIAFLEDALTGPKKPPGFVSVLQALWVVSRLCGSYSDKDDLGHYFRIADKLPRIAGTDIYRGIIAQFYASDFWTATAAL